MPRNAVCKPCNNRIDREIDRAVQDDLRVILGQLEIPGKRGTATQWTPTEIVDGEARKFIVNKTTITGAEPRKLLSRTDNSYSFRATSRGELERARDEIAAKHLDKQVQLSEIIERVPNFPEERVDEIDFSRPHWARWAAKTCINVICYVFGQDVVRRPEFDDFRELALSGGLCPADLRFGGIGQGTPEVDELPAEHRIEVFADSAGLRVHVTLFSFCALLLSRSAIVLRRVHREIVLDAANKKVVTDTGR